MTTKGIIYLRVSSASQLDGFGLEIQEKACRTYAKQHGIRIVGVFRDEGISGTVEGVDREGMTAALNRMQDGEVDALIVARLDRLSRKLTVQEAIFAEVWRRNRTVHSADSGEIKQDDPDDPMRTAMRQMAGVFAQLDRALITKRLRDGRKAKAARGEHAVGPAPFGWKAERGKLTPIPQEQAALQLMRELRATGHTTRAIAEFLQSAGHPTKRGGRWTSPVVSRILQRADDYDTEQAA